MNGNIGIIGVPLDLGVPELGLKLGPKAIREAGLVRALSSVGLDVDDQGDLEFSYQFDPESDLANQKVKLLARYCETLSEMVSKTISSGRVAVCIGGDHSLSIGSLAGAVQTLGRVSCLWMDSHPDAHTPETSPTGNIHGMPVAILLGHGPRELCDVGGSGATLSAKNVCLLGAHNIDVEEAQFIKKNNISNITLWDIVEKGIGPAVDTAIKIITRKARNVHVSIDVDVLNEAIAPGVGIPTPVGFDLREAMFIARKLSSKCNIVSIDVVGLNPVRDHNMATAKRTIELIAAFLGKDFGFNYQAYLKSI